MGKNGNITGEVFDEGVIQQIEIRQNFLGARYKSDANLVYTNNNNAFLRLASSVNVGTTSALEVQISGSTINDTAAQEKAKSDLLSEGVNKLTERNIQNKDLVGANLAKACVLFGGVVGVDDQLNPIKRFGVVDNGASGAYDYINTIAAYGWGGISSKGFVPMPSIESADVTFVNRGALAKASVKIKVYSVEQLQIFDLLYFRIGYTMLLEWGHNIWIDNQLALDTNNINPIKQRTKFATKPFELFFKEGTSQQDIIKAIKDQRVEESYNYDAMLGKVTNFSWKFNDDGSYDIDLNLVGLGDIIESLKINTAKIITKGADITPSQARAKAKKAVAAKKEQINQNKDKPAADAEAAKKSFTDALSSYNSFVNKQNLNDFFTNLKALALEYEDANADLYNNASNVEKVNRIIYNLNENSDFKGIQYTVSLAKSEYAFLKTEVPRNDSDILDVLIEGGANNGRPRWTVGVNFIINTLGEIYSRLGKLISLQSQAGVKADTAKTADAQTEAELAALENTLKAVAKAEEIASLSPDTSVESKNKTALNLQLYNWRQEAIKGNDKKNLFKLTLTANSANPDTTGAATLSLNFYYVRLGYLLEWIQNNLLYYDTSKLYNPSILTSNTGSATTGSAVNPNQLPPQNANPIFTINTDVETNFCLRFPSQFSSDPRVCVVPSNYTNKSLNVSWDILPEIKGYVVDNNDYIGKLMNLFVNVDHVAGCIDKNTDTNGKTNLLKFLTSLCNDINDALGNVNKLEPIFDSEANQLKIIEGSSLENVKDQLEAAEKKNHPMGVFQVYGIGTKDIPYGSFITNVDFQVQLPPNMAAMATISAQAKGNIVGENATGLSKLNTGLVDRLITVKLDKESIEGAATGKADPKVIFKNNIEYVSKTIKQLYQQKLFAPDTIESVRSANRDISLYLTGNDALDNKMPAPFFIPFNLSLNMNGLSGMKNYERFSITEQILPYSYRSGNQGGVIDFLIKGVSHSIKDNKWETKIESLSVSSNRKTSEKGLQSQQ
jgi:hypothetical protein